MVQATGLLALWATTPTGHRWATVASATQSGRTPFDHDCRDVLFDLIGDAELTPCQQPGRALKIGAFTGCW